MLITEDQREIVVRLGIEYSAMQEMIKDLKCWKFSLTADR
jgi:hypothetical protein